MPASLRRTQRPTNIWPGFVDALATLLLVLIFLVMVFVLAQFFLNEAISGRDEALQKLDNQVTELADLLSLERKANADLRGNVRSLSDELQASVRTRDRLSGELRAMTDRATAADKLAADRAAEIARLAGAVERLQALKADLEAEVGKLASELEDKGKALLAEKELSESARAEVALLNTQLAALGDQLQAIETALEISERKNAEQQAQIVSLGKRLNAALATKVQELSRYRSEFFGRLRELLGDRPGIRVVGDRFVFQSEVLFDTGSAELGDGGRAQIDSLARTLRELMAKIPEDIDWVLRVDGHTDNVPINNWRFPSNWELSSARAISVVKYLISKGVPAKRLVAAGFGEFQPIDRRSDEIARRRNRRIELKLTQR